MAASLVTRHIRGKVLPKMCIHLSTSLSCVQYHSSKNDDGDNSGISN
jgi:hypothetical protein